MRSDLLVTSGNFVRAKPIGIKDGIENTNYLVITNKNKLNDYTWIDGVAGDGAVFLSIEDFIKWNESLTKNTIISESTFIDLFLFFFSLFLF